MKIGDTVADVLEGVNSRCSIVIGITSDPNLETKMKKNGATHVVNDIKKIMTVL